MTRPDATSAREGDDEPRRGGGDRSPEPDRDRAAERPRSLAPTPLADTLDSLLRELGVAPPPTAARVLAVFQEVAGDGLRGIATATRFERGLLLVDVASAAHTQELVQFTGKALQERLNAALGSPLVREIRFRHRVTR